MYEAWMMKSGVSFAVSVGLFALLGSVHCVPPPMDMNVAISTADSSIRSRAAYINEDEGVYQEAYVRGGDDFNPSRATTYVSGDDAQAIARGRSRGSALSNSDDAMVEAFLMEYADSLSELDNTEAEIDISGEANIYVSPLATGSADASIYSLVRAKAEEEGSQLSELLNGVIIETSDSFISDPTALVSSARSPTAKFWITNLVAEVQEDLALMNNE